MQLATLNRPRGADTAATGRAATTAGPGLVAATVKTFLTAAVAGVETDDGDSLHARQAVSCLLAPAIGDRVLIHADSDECYILAILARPSDHAAEISVPGARELTLAAPGKLALRAGEVTVTARRIGLLAQVMFQTGEALTSNFRRIVETVIDKTVAARSITTKAAMRTAVVTEVELLHAGTLIQNIDTVATQNSEIAMTTARRDVRLDGERVSIG